MFLRFSQILLIYFLLFSYVESAESGGMPQLNPEFWFSQIFWLIISFGIMFILLSKFVLPKISENLEIRKAQILENIEVAEKQREDIRYAEGTVLSVGDNVIGIKSKDVIYFDKNNAHQIEIKKDIYLVVNLAHVVVVL